MSVLFFCVSRQDQYARACLVSVVLFVFFFQAEDGIRDAHWGLEFGRVLFRSAHRRCGSGLGAGDASPRPARRARGSAGCRRFRFRRARCRQAARAARRARPAGAGARSVAAQACSCQHAQRSEEHTSELQSLMRISYAVFCLKKKTKTKQSQDRKRQSQKKNKEYTRIVKSNNTRTNRTIQISP